MARKMTKAQSNALFTFFLMMSGVGLLIKVVEEVGPTLLIGSAIASFTLYFWYKRTKHKQRMAYLMSKYNDEGLVAKIMSGYFWEGQTEEQLVDSIGRPLEIDEKKLKTKRKEIWKYNNQGHKRFGLRIIVENGLVVGWDKKAS